MLGKLILFEIRKSVKDRFVVIAIVALLVVNAVPYGEIRQYVETRKQFQDKAMELGEDAEDITLLGYLASNREYRDLLERESYFWKNLTPGEVNNFESAMQEKYGEDIWEREYLLPTDEMLLFPGYFGEEWSDFDGILYLRSQREASRKIQENMENVLRAAKAHGREAIKNADDYGVRRNLNIIKLYSADRARTAGPVRGWEAFLFENHFMFFVFLLVFLICAGCFSVERDQQTWLLLHTAKCGRRNVAMAKYISGALLSIVLTVVFWGSSLMREWMMNGLLGAEEPVNKLEKLLLCPYPITVWQYGLLSLGCQLLAAVILSVLMNCISACSRTGVISYVVGLLALGGAVLFMYLPGRAEWLAGPLSLAYPLRFFSSYYTAKVFGYPVLWIAVQMILWGMICVVAVAVSQRAYNRDGR